MSPVDPSKIKGIKPHLIDHDRPCINCGYNLVGLMSNVVCPECGRKINIKKKDLPRYGDNLVNAPMGWLAGFATAGMLLFVGSIGVFGASAVAVAMWGRNLIPPVIATAFAILWLAGVVLVTRPRPVTKATTIEPRKEWRQLRWFARGTQVFWLIGAGLLLGFSATAPIWFVWASIPCFGIATAGMIPLCILLSNLAYWGSDSTLAGHCRACAWAIGFSGLLLTLHYINVFTGARLMGGAIAAMISLALVITAAFPFLYMIFVCFQLQAMSRWAMFNHATAEAKDERLRQRAERMARQGPATPPPDAPIGLDSINLSDSDVSHTPGAGGAVGRTQGYTYKAGTKTGSPSLPLAKKKPQPPGKDA